MTHRADEPRPTTPSVGDDATSTTDTDREPEATVPPGSGPETEPLPVAPAHDDPLGSNERTEELQACPGCHGTTGSGAFCENCGTDLAAASGGEAHTAPTASVAGSGSSAATPDKGMLVLGGPLAEPATPAAPPAADTGARCECGGTFADAYCEQCGSPEPHPRDHMESAAATWAAGVTDVGVHHRSNQDAMALSVDGSRGAFVVCDGVSSALRSEDASQAAADAAVTVLTHATSTGVGVPSSVIPAMSARLAAATDAAADAVAQVTAAVHRELGTDPAADQTHATNPSCTFVGATVEGRYVVVGSVGDSRGYWFPDDAEPVRLTTDDSWAEEQIALGATREQAESGPGAHTITRWLGIDAPDHAPRTTAVEIDRPGWLVLCSDGLWNYASEPAALGAVLRDVAEPLGGAAGADPLELSRGLVQWANAAGGHDNITVVAARLPIPGATPTTDDHEEAPHG